MKGAIATVVFAFVIMLGIHILLVHLVAHYQRDEEGAILAEDLFLFKADPKKVFEQSKGVDLLQTINFFSMMVMLKVLSIWFE